MVPPNKEITLNLVRELASKPRRSWREFHLNVHARMVWFERQNTNLGVNFSNGSATVEFCTSSRLKKRVKLGYCDTNYLRSMFEDPVWYSKHEVWCDVSRRSIKKEGRLANHLNLDKVRRELANDTEKMAIRKKRFGRNDVWEDSEKLLKSMNVYSGNNTQDDTMSIADSIRSAEDDVPVSTSTRTENVVRRIRRLVLADSGEGIDSETRRVPRNYAVIANERSSVAEKGSRIVVHGSRNLINFLLRIDPADVELLTISPDGLGALYYCVENGEFIWQDAHRISFGITMLNLLNTKVRQRASCLSVGVGKRYFLQRTDGETWYRGPDLLSEVANSETKVKCVAFGSCYDSVVVLCDNGSVLRTEQIPVELMKVLDGDTDVQFVSMGPSGEWFVKLSGDEYQYGGVNAEMKTKLDKCGPKLKEVTFGSKAFIARCE